MCTSHAIIAGHLRCAHTVTSVYRFQTGFDLVMKPTKRCHQAIIRCRGRSLITELKVVAFSDAKTAVLFINEVMCICMKCILIQ